MTRSSRVPLTRLTLVEGDRECSARYKGCAAFYLLRLAPVTQLCPFMTPCFLLQSGVFLADVTKMLMQSQGTHSKADSR